MKFEIIFNVCVIANYVIQLFLYIWSENNFIFILNYNILENSCKIRPFEREINIQVETP